MDGNLIRPKMQKLVDDLPNKPSNYDIYAMSQDTNRLSEEWFENMDPKEKWLTLKLQHKVKRIAGNSNRRTRKLMGLKH